MSSRPASRLVCAGCGYEAPLADPLPFRCPHAASGAPGHDTDHVLSRELAPASPTPPALLSSAETRALFAAPEPNPFLRYRPLLHSHFRALHHAGLSDDAFAARVRALDERVARVESREHGFRETPFAPRDRLAAALEMAPGTLWGKDETGNVSGSHKARHLFGVLLWLELFAGEIAADAPLAIASCGNAALAAAVVARAAERRLEVFVPPDAHPRVLSRLGSLGARLVTCPRVTGEAGDPCFLRFREAVTGYEEEGGSLPFTCQGSENALVIEGGKTLAWEMVSRLVNERGEGSRLPDRLFVQVGGGALASAVIQGLEEARRFGLLDRLPRIHPVQTRGASPLHRAWRRVAERALDAGRREEELPDAELARLVASQASRGAVEAALTHAATHRSRYMWPWEDEPRSLATGILDDETYDWLAVVEGMLRTGGFPIVVSEAELAEAHRLAREHTALRADPTGTAGLAGLLHLRRAGGLAAGESAAVLFTGAER